MRREQRRRAWGLRCSLLPLCGVSRPISVRAQNKVRLVQKEGQCPPHLRPRSERTWINGDDSAPALGAHHARWSIRDDAAAWVSERLSIACASAGGLHA